MSPLPYDDDDVVLVVDGQVRGRKKTSPASPSAWLKTWTPEGVYTSARTYRGIKVSRWGAHVARLRRMLRALFAHDPSKFEGVGLPTSDAEMEAIVEDSVKEALQECAMQGIKGPGDGARERPKIADATATPSLTFPSRDPPLPPLAVLGASLGGEVMLVVAVSPKPETGGYRVGVHATPLHDDRDDDGIVVAVCAPPRELPTVKSTSWPADREWIREDAPEDADECVLARDGGECLVEGLTNNLFVVVKGPDGKPLVRTAPEGECLPGLARAAVLAACETEGIAVEARAPEAAERKKWKEAFVTNAVRLARPVREVRWPRGVGVDLSRGAEDVALGGELVVELAECPGPVTKQILERLVATADEDPGPRD